MPLSSNWLLYIYSKKSRIFYSDNKTIAIYKYTKGPTGVWTRVGGFKVRSANHYTIEPIFQWITTHHIICSWYYSTIHRLIHRRFCDGLGWQSFIFTLFRKLVRTALLLLQFENFILLSIYVKNNTYTKCYVLYNNIARCTYWQSYAVACVLYTSTVNDRNRLVCLPITTYSHYSLE